MAMTKEELREYRKKWLKDKYDNDPVWREQQKAKARERGNAKYRSDPAHRQKKIAYQKQLNEKNASRVQAYQKQYKIDHKDSLRVSNRDRKRLRYANDYEFREKAKQERRDRYKTPEYRAYANARRSRIKAGDPSSSILENLRGRVRQALRGKDKSASTMELIGCTLEQLRSHLEKQFKPGMAWSNYGYYGWHVDHHKPCASFRLDDPAQQRECFHYTNLRPLWREENQSKGATLDSLANKAIPRFPISTVTDEDADRAFASLRITDMMRLWVHGPWSSKSEVPGKKELFIGGSNIGLAASNRFHFNARMACDSAASPSPMRSWFDPTLRDKLESSQLYDFSPKMALSMRRYIPLQFRPSAAKAIYQAFGASTVFDPCGGWGDRMAAALATDTVSRYHCRDVNPHVFGGYSGQIERYDANGKVSAEMVPAEVGGLAGLNFDLIFTSPPYYSIETYHGPQQSNARYRSFDEWLHGFLYQMVSHSWSALKTGGHMAINISDCYAERRLNKICSPLVEWSVANLSDCQYLGAAGYRLATRIGSNRATNGVTAEPILIFSKGPSDWMDRMLARFPAPAATFPA